MNKMLIVLYLVCKCINKMFIVLFLVCSMYEQDVDCSVFGVFNV